MRTTRLPVPSILGLAVVLLATVLMVPVLAGNAGIRPTEDDQGEFNNQEADFTYESTFDCSEGELSYAVFPMDLGEGDGMPVDPEQVDETDLGEELTEVRFHLPDLAGGEYTFERYCDDEMVESRDFRFSRVLLTKTVEGETDTSFTVNVACASSEAKFNEEPTDVNRQFGPDGGEDQVVFYTFVHEEAPVTCEITEPEDGGAADVTIDPETLTYTEYSDGSSTVTNTFPAPEEPSPEPSPSPSPSPEPSPSPSPSPAVDDTVDEAEPAEPVETEPDFTG